MLLGVALNAMTTMLGRVVRLPHALRLTIVCLVLASLLSGVVFLGGTTIAQQATALSDTIKSQLVNVKAFLERNGIDTSYFELGNSSPASGGFVDPATPAPAATHNLPSAGAIASSGGAIVSQTLKLLLGTVSAVGNFFIVLFLGLTFAAQPSVYRNGLLFMAPARHRARATVIVDRISETLERWLIAQIITMFVVFLVTWIGLAIIGIQSSFILGIQAGLLTFIPTVGALIAGLIVVLASLASGWVAAASAFALFFGVHALESYILTPIPASGAGYSPRHPVCVPDPARRGVRHLGAGAGPAADRDRESHDRLFQGRRNFSRSDGGLRRRVDRRRSTRRGQHRLGMFDLGRRGKILPDQSAPCREILGAPEIDGMIFQRLPLRHQPVARRLLDRLVEFKTLAALGAQEQRASLGYRGFKVLLAARLDVNQRDFGDHAGYDLS